MVKLLREPVADQMEIERDTQDGVKSLILIGSDDIYEQKIKDKFEFELEENGRIPDAYLLKAIELTGGNITRAAKIAGVHRSLYYQRATEIEGFREKMIELRETKLDFAEDKLWEHVQYGNLPAVMFYLRTIGKERGYTTQVEMVGNKEKPININVNFKDDLDDTDEIEDEYS